MSIIKTSARIIGTAIGSAGRRPLLRHCKSSTAVTPSVVASIVPPRSAAISMSAHAARTPATAMLCRAEVMEEVRVLFGERDRYNGIHVDLERMQETSPEEFAMRLEASLGQWIVEKRSSAWLRVPIEKSAFISEAAKFGFKFHHAEDQTAMLYLWLRPGSCKIHPYASHQVGVAGCVINTATEEVLVIRDKGQMFSSWKFPGGLSDLGEDIGETARREVFEETGLRTEFNGILAFRQQHRLPGAFGRSDIFFVCRMTPITFDVKPCAEEISAWRWIPLSELTSSNETSALTKHVALLAKQGLDRGFDDITIGCAERLSIFRNRRYNMYSRRLDSAEDLDDSRYLHDAVDSRIDQLMN